MSFARRDNALTRKQRTLLAFAVLLAASGPLLWTSRLELLNLGLRSFLVRLGFGPVASTVVRLGPDGALARDIALYGGAVQVEEVMVAFSPVGIFGGHADAVSVSGLRVRLERGESGLTLGGRPLPLPRAGTRTQPAGTFGVDRVKISGAHLVLDAKEGSFELAGEADLDLRDPVTPQASFSLDVMVAEGETRSRFHVEAPQIDLLTQGEEGGPLLRFSKAVIVARDHPWSATDVGGQLQWRADAMTARLGARLTNPRQPALVAPLLLVADVSMREARLAFTLQASVEADSKQAALILRGKGQHDLSSASGTARFAMEPYDLHRNGAQPADFFPVIDRTLPPLSGSVGLSGSLQWRKNTWTPDLLMRLVNVSTEVADSRLGRISGDIRFTGLRPPLTPPGQVLGAIVEAGGLPPSETTLTFQLLEGPVLKVEGISFGFAGGTIAATPFLIDPARPEVETVLHLDRVDLAEVLRLIDVDGLSGTGRLRGKIPLRFASGQVGFGEEGRLEATEPGVLHFRSDKPPPELAASGKEVTLALQALDDFHYKSLTMDLKKEADGKGALLLRLRGGNPAVLDGRPFHFNVSFESDFDKLTNLALRGMTSTRQLLLRAERSIRP